MLREQKTKLILCSLTLPKWTECNVALHNMTNKPPSCWSLHFFFTFFERMFGSSAVKGRKTRTDGERRHSVLLKRRLKPMRLSTSSIGCADLLVFSNLFISVLHTTDKNLFEFWRLDDRDLSSKPQPTVYENPLPNYCNMPYRAAYYKQIKLRKQPVYCTSWSKMSSNHSQTTIRLTVR